MTFLLPSRRLIVIGGFAFAISAAPAVAIFAAPASTPTPVAECMSGEMADAATGVCMPGASVDAPAAIQGNPDLPAVDGVPCTGANTGECIGLEESHGGEPVPVP
jgi:hypothetical protein